jgi:hypothetical protein
VAAALTDVILIPYGVAEWSPDGLAIEGFSARTLRLRTAFPCAAINRAARAPLRFNTSRYESGFAPGVQAGAGDDAALVKDYLKGLCRPWDKLAVQFLDAYFAYLADLLDEQSDLLAARLAPFAGLYKPADWLFSAPKPLPRAHLHAPSDSAASAAAGIDPAGFVRVDFAFWLGDRLVAAQSSQSALTPKKAKEQADRLRTAGIETFTFAPADLAGAKARDFFTRLLGSAAAFWDGQPLPVGPFRAALIDD